MVSVPTKANATLPPMTRRLADAINRELLLAMQIDAIAQSTSAALISLRGPNLSISIPTGICNTT